MKIIEKMAPKISANGAIALSSDTLPFSYSTSLFLFGFGVAGSGSTDLPGAHLSFLFESKPFELIFV